MHDVQGFGAVTRAIDENGRRLAADARWAEAERHSEARRCSRWITEYLSLAFRDGQLDASARARIAEGDRAFWKLHIEPYAGWANVR